MSKITVQNGRESTGRFAKGNKGKPKGAQTKTTKAVKEFVVGFLNDKSVELYSIWDELEPRDKATLFLHLSRMVVPKPQVEMGGVREIEPINIIVKSMSGEEKKPSVV